MGRNLILSLFLVVFSMVSFAHAGQEAKTQTGKKDLSVRQMSVNGEIGKVKHGYVLRSEGPGTIFTILNPDPILDPLVESGKTVKVDIRIVSGDNVNIETIDGKPYPKATKDTQVRQMTINGEVGKVKHGYVIRSEGPGTIFTVLNPDPKLDPLVESGKMVKIDIRIVSGDNVNIEKIDGKKYP